MSLDAHTDLGFQRGDPGRMKVVTSAERLQINNPMLGDWLTAFAFV
jgi:hypothetical protein